MRWNRMIKIPLNNDEIKKIVSNLEKKELKTSSHLYKRFPGHKIGQACEGFSSEYSKEAVEKPGLVLLSVILAAHRNYTKQVEPCIDRLRKQRFNTFNDLKTKTQNFSYFSAFCGMNDYQKYGILVNLLNTIEKLKKSSGMTGDYEVMEKWAKDTNYYELGNDPIGSIKGIGIATFQHLRMNFGANTVKPDQRVKEVLNKEFNFASNDDIDCINAVEQISEIVGKSALYLDQVFVNYGSGYYVKDYENDIGNSDIHQKSLKIDDSILLEPTPNNSKYNVKADNHFDSDMNIEDNVILMREYLNKSTEGMAVHFKTRNDGGVIVELNSPTTRVKNLFTFWPTLSSISVIILGLLEPRKVYRSVYDMEQDRVATKIKSKYNELAGW